MPVTSLLKSLLLLMAMMLCAIPASALTPAQARAIVVGDNESRISALNAVLDGADEKTVALIQALSDDAVKFTDTDKVIAAMAGQTFTAPSGITSMMDPKNHHLHKSVFIGEIKADGQFNVVWKTPGPVKAKPWSPYIEGNDKKPDEPVVAKK